MSWENKETFDSYLNVFIINRVIRIQIQDIFARPNT